jgi:hypothetical protein
MMFLFLLFWKDHLSSMTYGKKKINMNATQNLNWQYTCTTGTTGPTPGREAACKTNTRQSYNLHVAIWNEMSNGISLVPVFRKLSSDWLIPDFEIRISNIGYRISNLEPRISNFESRFSNFGSQSFPTVCQPHILWPGSPWLHVWRSRESSAAPNVVTDRIRKVYYSLTNYTERGLPICWYHLHRRVNCIDARINGKQICWWTGPELEGDIIKVKRAADKHGNGVTIIWILSRLSE